MKVALVSDYFYPAFGGVESHIIGLANALKRSGHDVIVITHKYNKDNALWVGKRQLFLTPHATVTEVEKTTNVTIPVYYLPMGIVAAKCIFPCLLPTHRFIPDILENENIDIVHGHSSMSALVHDSIWIAKAMNIKTVLTDHSLIGFADVGAIVCNKLLEGTLCDKLTLVICVSYCSAANTIQRCNIDPNLVFVIPNAISDSFDPDLIDCVEKREVSMGKEVSMRKERRINVAVSCRLEYRRGIDLLIGIIPRICRKHSQVDFIIIGDGPYRVKIEEISERHFLTDRVHMKGMVKHSDVPSVLNQADIFLNTALTEAFCIAIVEAVRMGLLVVSTDVGGVPEVLPDVLMTLAKPEVGDLFEKLDATVDRFKSQQCLSRNEITRIGMTKYNWKQIGKKTTNVYKKCIKIPPKSFVNRLNDFGSVEFNGKFYQALLILQAAIFTVRRHSSFEFIFYFFLFLFITYFVAILLSSQEKNS